MLIRYVAVGEDAVVYVEVLDELGKVLFRVDGNAIRVEGACELGRILPAFDVGNLRCGERDDVVLSLSR